MFGETNLVLIYAMEFRKVCSTIAQSSMTICSYLSISFKFSKIPQIHKIVKITILKDLFEIGNMILLL